MGTWGPNCTFATRFVEELIIPYGTLGWTTAEEELWLRVTGKGRTLERQHDNRFRELTRPRIVTADVINMSILLRFETVEPSAELTAGSGVPVTIVFTLALKMSVQSKNILVPVTS